MSLFIFRRDYRVNDNTGLINCINDSIKVKYKIYPIFIFSKNQIRHNEYKSDNSVQFMIESLLDMDINLNYFFGDEIKVLNEIITNNNIKRIYVNKDYTPYSKLRDELINKLCLKLNIEFISYEDYLLVPVGTVLTGTKTVYKKYSSFYSKFIKTQKINNPIECRFKNFQILKHTKYTIYPNQFYNLYKKNSNLELKGGRKEALKKFNITTFNDNKLFVNSSTNLSPYIKFGCISIREVFYNYKNNEDIIKQLIWREFFYNIGYYYEIFNTPLKEKYKNIKWNNNKYHLDNWKNGKTGYPIIDAIMIQLNITGNISNRSRLITSSFLVKILLINWIEGEKYFAQKLVDYDPIVNNQNWQWIASVGVDSTPYFRIFNPWLQSKKFDPNCDFIKLMIPQLKNVENKKIHNWFQFYDEKIYIKPIVDYTENKNKTIEAYKKIFN